MTLVTAFVVACSDDDPHLGLTKDGGATSLAGSSGASMVEPGAGGGAGKASSTGGHGQGALSGQGGTGGSGGAANSHGGSGGSGGAAAGGVKASGGTTAAGGHPVTGGTGVGSAGASGSMGDAAPDAPHLTACKPDPKLMCDSCVQTKCCPAWLDCANDKNCLGTTGGMQGEFFCIQTCLTLDETTTVGDCADMCRHGATVSPATDALISCVQATSGLATTQNCTNECFGRALP
jgi:hypothetical protein